MPSLHPTGKILRIAVAVFLSTAIAASPVFAGNGNGNGGGHGGGNGGGHGGGKGNSGHSASVGGGQKTTKANSHKTAKASSGQKVAKASVSPSQKLTKTVPANELGSLNGFLHASPKAYANAAPNSAIGKVHTYAGLLQGYLSPEPGVTPPTLAEVAASLDAAANKPLSTSSIEAVNAKLQANDPALAQSIDNYSGGAPALAEAIDNAL